MTFDRQLIMDSEEEREVEMEIEETLDDRKKGYDYVVLRLILAIIFPIAAFFSLSLFIGFLAVLAAHFSISTPISVPSQCRIVSSSKSLFSLFLIYAFFNHIVRKENSNLWFFQYHIIYVFILYLLCKSLSNSCVLGTLGLISMTQDKTFLVVF